MEVNVISVENLTKYYGDNLAVDNLSFEIKKGEILGLLGPNGAGKSTTYRILTGFLNPTSGTIKVKDLDIKEDLLKIKKIIGYLPESAPLYKSMLVFEYLNYIADLRDVPNEGKLSHIKELADLCSLNEVMHMRIDELSKGYRQRVGIAHSLMGDPEILVLDEPISGLDPNQIADTREIIKRIGKEKTIIYSTHILSEAESTCDRIIIIDKGKMVIDGTANQIKEKTKTDTLEDAFKMLTSKRVGEK